FIVIRLFWTVMEVGFGARAAADWGRQTALAIVLCGLALSAVPLPARAATFEPSLAVSASSVADSPSALGLRLDLAPEGEPALEPAPAPSRLPSGLGLAPSGLAAVQGCSPAQIGLSSAARTTPASFDSEPPACPTASNLGSIEADSSLAAGPLRGALYLATP